MLPYISQFEIKYSPQEPTFVVSDFSHSSVMVPNEVCDLFCIFNAKQLETKTTVSIAFKDSVTEKVKSIDIEIDLKSAKEDPTLIKLALHKMPRLLDGLSQKQRLENLHKALDEKFKMSLLDLSLKYSILNDLTAFICNIKEGDDISKEIPAKFIIVPHIRSKEEQRQHARE